MRKYGQVQNMSEQRWSNRILEQGKRGDLECHGDKKIIKLRKIKNQMCVNGRIAESGSQNVISRSKFAYTHNLLDHDNSKNSVSHLNNTTLYDDYPV